MSNSLLSSLRSCTDIKGPARVVMIVLADRADDRGKSFPSHATLSRETGFSKSTVKKHLKTLSNNGFVSWQPTHNSLGCLSSNIYTINLGNTAKVESGVGREATEGGPGDGVGVGQRTARGGSGDGYKASNKLQLEASTKIECPVEGELIESIWNIVPKMARERSSKIKLESAWRDIPALQRPRLDLIENALAAWKQSKSWTDRDGQFVPGIHRWIKERRWESLPDPAKPLRPKFAGIIENIEIPT